jgi:multiple sugar transport system permease protein
MPLLWIISTSLRLPKDSFSLPPLFIPVEFVVENYREVFTKLPFDKFILNSLFVTVVGTCAQICVTTMAAYAFARIKFVGKNVVFLMILAGLMIPIQSTIVPKFIVIRQMSLINTLWALILPAIIDPLAIFLLRQFMMTIPSSYDESAYIDGAGRFAIFTKIILPMSIPTIAVIVTIRSLVLWNDFFQPLIFINSYDYMTLPLGLTVLKGHMGNGSISIVLAGVVLSSIPPLLIYIFCQKQLMSSAVLAGLKS